MAVIKKIEKWMNVISRHRFVKPLISALEVTEKAKTVREIVEYMNGLSLTAFVFVWGRNMAVQTAIPIFMVITAVLVIVVSALVVRSRYQKEHGVHPHKRIRRRTAR